MIRTVKIRSPLNKSKLMQVHKFMETYSNCVNYFIARLWTEKKLDLSNISSLVVENLKYVKHKTRGMFSRTHNRRLSRWLYARVINWLAMRCEEQGIRLEFKSPFKTSQRCPLCGKWDRRNRNGEKFKCIFCGHEDHADSIGSQNLKLLGLAGVYSLRSLQTLTSGCL